jgi:hypothetical protein
MKFQTVIRCSTANTKPKDSPKTPNYSTFGVATQGLELDKILHHSTFGSCGIALVIYGDAEFFNSGKNYLLTIENTDLDENMERVKDV